MDIKKCRECKEYLLVEKFNKDNSKKDGLRRICRDCESEKHREYYVNNTEKCKQNARYDRLRRYGISQEEFEEMVDEQEGRCAICKIKLTLLSKDQTSACVDHDHDTGRVRGILCRKCNGGLGLLGDKLDNMKKVISYLERGEKSSWI